MRMFPLMASATPKAHPGPAVVENPVDMFDQNSVFPPADAPFCANTSEVQFQSQLPFARSDERRSACDLAKIRVAQIDVRRGEIRVVEDVEELRAEFDVHPFTPRKREPFPYIHVRAEQMWPVNQPAAGVPDGVLRWIGKYGCI